MDFKDVLLSFIIAALLIVVFNVAGCQSGNGKIFGIFGSGSSGDGPGGAIDDGKESLFNAVKGSNWLVTFSILGMAAGVFALMNGSKIGISAIVASGASLFMALAVARFAAWMAVCGFIGAVAAVGVSILVKNRALKEVVGNVRDIKESAANGGSKKKICADIKNVLAKQTKSTKKIVSKIKAKIKLEDRVGLGDKVIAELRDKNGNLKQKQVIG